uniref:Uncharacterized protein n=1 Tax=Siphoviridae sp. ctcj91 TaxID=2826395 RepID=A0A8S5QXV7_9CAUD|nr:MAG TPA: hypothetical protein [Siphoviridae sp. ctcj91]
MSFQRVERYSPIHTFPLRKRKGCCVTCLLRCSDCSR